MIAQAAEPPYVVVMRAKLIAVVLASVACGGAIEPVSDDASADVATADAATDSNVDSSDDASTCSMLWCGDHWVTCDETGHAICQNRKAVCVQTAACVAMEQ